MDPLLIALIGVVILLINANTNRKEPDSKQEELVQILPIDLVIEEIEISKEKSTFLLRLQLTNTFMTQADSIDELVKHLRKNFTGLQFTVNYGKEKFNLST